MKIIICTLHIAALQCSRPAGGATPRNSRPRSGSYKTAHYDKQSGFQPLDCTKTSHHRSRPGFTVRCGMREYGHG